MKTENLEIVAFVVIIIAVLLFGLGSAVWTGNSRHWGAGRILVIEIVIIGLSIGFLIGYSMGLLVGYGMVMTGQ